MAWNTWRHLEAWYGILGIGAIYHTVNPRLFVDQICWIVNHAEDRMMFVDLTFLPILDGLIGRTPGDVDAERYLNAWVDHAVRTVTAGRERAAGRARKP